jgi:SAM-dependent methyltransferase
VPADILTTQFYDKEAAEYAAVPPHGTFLEYRNRLVSLLPGRAHILDLGCGGGHDGRAFRDAGFEVTALDASAAMAALASARIGRNVIVRSFQELNFVKQFDAVWASASLLHVPFDELPDVLIRVRRSLRTVGLLCASFKEGEKDRRDQNGRLFCAMTEALLREHLTHAGFDIDIIDQYQGRGSDAMPTTWLWVFCRSSGKP